MTLSVLAIPALADPGDEYLATARAALQRGDGIAAEFELKRAREAGVTVDRLAALMGEAFLVQEDYAEARRWLAPGLFSEDEYAHGYFMLAKLQIAEGNLPGAKQAFDLLLEKSPGTAEIWVEIGRLRYRMGQHHQAIAASAHALELDDQDPHALRFRGQLVRDSEGLIAALPWFEKGLEAAPENIALLGDYAATLGEAGRTTDMLRITRRMIELEPDNPQPFFLQAVMAARAGNTQLARRLLWRTSSEFRNTVPAALLLAGVLELRSGNGGTAAEIFAGMLRSQPDNRAVQQLFAEALLADGQAAEVIARFRGQADLPGASRAILLLVGRALELRGDRLEAASYLDRAAKWGDIQPAAIPVGEQGELTIFRSNGEADRPDVAIARIRQAINNGDYAAAQPILAELGDRYHGSADFQVLGGDLALLEGNPTLALNNYRGAAVVRRNFSLIERMVAAYRASGEERAAREVLSDYLEQHPQHAEAAALLGRLSLDAGQWQRASALLDYAAQVGPEADPRLLAGRAKAALQLGDVDKAIVLASEAYRLQRWNPQIAGLYGEALKAKGGYDAEARVLLAKASKGIVGS